MFNLKKKITRKHLSQDEELVLEGMIVNGETNEEIAADLGISHNSSEEEKEDKETKKELADIDPDNWDEKICDIEPMHHHELKQYVIYLEKDRNVKYVIVEADNAMKAAKKAISMKSLKGWMTTDIKFIK